MLTAMFVVGGEITVKMENQFERKAEVLDVDSHPFGDDHYKVKFLDGVLVTGITPQERWIDGRYCFKAKKETV